ncbi:MAG: GTPase [Patescibacteria group bacterium]
MSTIAEQIEEIEKEIRETPYHKGTEHHIGMMRAKLSKLKDKELEKSSKKGGGGGGYAVKKQGDATIVLVGPPSAGKSTLINNLTNAQSKVAPYAFTTVTVIPGMFVYNDARIQILDVPGLIEGAEEGKGRGKEVLSVVRGANLAVLISDIYRPAAIERIVATLERNGIRINKLPPAIQVEKRMAGGVIIHSNIKQELDKQTIKDVASEFGVKNAEITIRECLTMDRLMDAFSSNRVYIPAIKVLNKADEVNSETCVKNKNSFYSLSNEEKKQYLLISVEKGIGMQKFRDRIMEHLGLVKVYLVRQLEEPNFDNPMVMKNGNTILDLAHQIGSEFLENKKAAKIWGTGAKFAGQEVSFETKLQEGMQIRFV